MNSALKKMGELPGPVSAIATGHGPMLVENKDSWIEKYKSWSEEVTKKMGPPGAHLLGQPAWREQAPRASHGVRTHRGGHQRGDA